MQVDFNRTFKNLKKTENIKEPDGQNDLTLGFVVTEALMSGAGDQSGAAKIKKFNLALQIEKTSVQEITSDNIKMFIDLVEKLFGPLIYVRVIEYLDPDRLGNKTKD